MCAPFIVPMAMAAASAGVGAIRSIMAGNSQAASLKAQSDFNKRQADIELIKGGYEASQKTNEGIRIQGAQQAGYAKAGVEGGTVVDTAVATGQEIDMDKQAIRFGSKLASSNYMYQSKIDNMNADQARMAGYLGAFTPIINAGTTLSGSFA